jgi:hypothetical protein
LPKLNVFINIIRDMARRSAMTPHEKVLSDLSSQELCLDLARKHAGCVKWTECDTCKRLTHEFRTEWRDDQAVEKKAVRRCIGCEGKFRARFHYEQIARLLYGRRPKPLSEVDTMTYPPKRNAYLKCMTHAETLLSRDLASVVNDPSYAMQRRQTASRELSHLQETIERKRERLEGELLVAARSSESFESRAEKMLNKFASIDSKKFFEKAILRYLIGKVRNATWTASLPLLEYLALEWLRDKRVLWRFLGDAFARWEEFQNPTSTRHKSAVMHQLLGSQSFRENCAERHIEPMAEVVSRLREQCAVQPAFDKLHGALRTQKSRQLSKSSAKQSAIPVTIR